MSYLLRSKARCSTHCDDGKVKRYPNRRDDAMRGAPRQAVANWLKPFLMGQRRISLS